MKLTDDDIENWITSSLTECIPLWNQLTNNLIIRGKTLEEVEQLKQQILDDHDLAGFVRTYLTATNLDKGLAFDNIMKRANNESKKN